jgi:hypothetical protein
MARLLLLTCSIWASAALVACGDDDGGGGPDAGSTCPVPTLSFRPTDVGGIAGVTRGVDLSMNRDYCEDATVTLVSSDPAVATVAEQATFTGGATRITVDVTAVATGTATITATWEAGADTRTAELTFRVTENAVPACSGMASGNLAPGGALTIDSGAALALAEGAARDDGYHVDAFDATIACAPDQVPAGFRALGPAIAFGPAHMRFFRELRLTLPMRLALLPQGAHTGHVEVSYTGPGVAEPRIVPVAMNELAGDWSEGRLVIDAPRLGTYQAVVAEAAGATRMREFRFRGIVGVSMGGSGSALIGYHNMERFDFIAPLGAAWDWAYMLSYIRTYHVGGFCTEAERVIDPTGCAMGATTARVPPRRWLHEHVQDFEHWWYEDDRRGQGGTFDRDEYIRLFRDLGFMFGNANTNRTDDPTEPNITPPGVPDSERDRIETQRCADPVVIPPYDGSSANTGFFDDEYNPEGTYPVITFCDGGELVVDGERDHGIWDPAGTHVSPIEVALAVDIDGDGRRGPGEPVIRSMWEPYRDCGLDLTCNADEAGYDPVTNPDPAGDDYDYQYNPAGTEGNYLRDGEPCGAGEEYDDHGLDGVMGTAQLAAGGFDSGEGDGCWTISRGAQRMIDNGPKHLVLNAPEEALFETDVFADGGIRDLFLAGPAASHSASAFAARGFSLRYYNAHSAIHLEGREPSPENFLFTDIDWRRVGRRIVVRYGDPDASPGRLEAGDGQHVGTNEEAVNRILSPLAWMSALWPDGDRRRVNDRLCRADTTGCTNPNQILVDFTAPSTMRSGPASIILPPGYYDDAFADYRYPVVYFLHGYGMSPEDLVDIGIIIWNFMISPSIPEANRLQKMIFVFPDGRCRGDECVKGTFYADAPESSPGAAQMETFMLELMDYVDENYRTRSPATFEVAD